MIAQELGGALSDRAGGAEEDLVGRCGVDTLDERLDGGGLIAGGRHVGGELETAVGVDHGQSVGGGGEESGKSVRKPPPTHFV